MHARSSDRQRGSGTPASPTVPSKVRAGADVDVVEVAEASDLEGVDDAHGDSAVQPAPRRRFGGFRLPWRRAPVAVSPS